MHLQCRKGEEPTGRLHSGTFRDGTGAEDWLAGAFAFRGLPIGYGNKPGIFFCFEGFTVVKDWARFGGGEGVAGEEGRGLLD